MGDSVDIIALDIGTSASRVAIYKNDQADVVADSDGHRYEFYRKKNYTICLQ